MTEFYVGTLTRMGGEGILHCCLEDDRILRKGLMAGTIDPNWVTLNRAGTRLYAVGSEGENPRLPGCVSEYDISGETPILLSRQATMGSAPCHIALDSKERFLYLANYASGSLCVFPVENGLQPMVQQICHAGSGPNPKRQASAHVHQVSFIPGTHYLAVCDLGTDEIVVYAANPQTGLLTEHSRTKLSGGPRHLAYSKQGFAYLVHELSNEVTVLRMEDGGFIPLQTLPTLPSGYSGTNTAAAIRVSRDQQQLFVTNRGHGSAAQFDIRADGSLMAKRHFSAGSFPRDFAELPDGRFLAADQNAGVRLLGRDGAELDLLPQAGAVCIALIEA